MTDAQAKKIEIEYNHYLMTTLNVLWLNGKITDKEYEKIRNRILDNKEVKN